jgi:hypothetical protein
MPPLQRTTLTCQRQTPGSHLPTEPARVSAPCKMPRITPQHQSGVLWSGSLGGVTDSTSIYIDHGILRYYIVMILHRILQYYIVYYGNTDSCNNDGGSGEERKKL